MSCHYGRQTIVLVDGYDVPLTKAEEKGYYDEMLVFMRGFLGNALKTNASGSCNQLSRLNRFLNRASCSKIKAKLKKNVVVPNDNWKTSAATKGKELIGVVPNPVELINAMPNEATNIPKDKTLRLLTLISGVVLVDILKQTK